MKFYPNLKENMLRIVKVRVALDWTLNLIFSKDLVEVPTLRATTISEAERSSNQNLKFTTKGTK
jgi:hypothetical protein